MQITDSIRKQYSNVKDLDKARPRYFPTPKAPKGRGREFGLYLQDLASDVMIDKYGLENGYKMWDNSIGQGKNGRAMFAMAQKVTDEKSQMINDLKLPMRDYFEKSYLEIWLMWKPMHGGK